MKIHKRFDDNMDMNDINIERTIIVITIALLFFSESIALDGTSINTATFPEFSPYADIRSNPTVIVDNQNMVYSNKDLVYRIGKQLLLNREAISTDELHEKLGLSCLSNSTTYSQSNCKNCLFYKIFIDEKFVFEDKKDIYKNDSITPAIIVRNIGNESIDINAKLTLYEILNSNGISSRLVYETRNYLLKLQPNETTVFTIYTSIEEQVWILDHSGEYAILLEFDENIRLYTCNDKNGIGVEQDNLTTKTFDVQSEFQRFQNDIQRQIIKYYEDSNKTSFENLQINRDLRDISDRTYWLNQEAAKQSNTIVGLTAIATLVTIISAILTVVNITSVTHRRKLEEMVLDIDAKYKYFKYYKKLR
jgi:hypothetical protein